MLFKKTKDYNKTCTYVFLCLYLLLYNKKVWQEKSLVTLVNHMHAQFAIQIVTYNYNCLVRNIHAPNFSLPKLCKSTHT